MVDESQIGEVIATNLVPDPRLTKILPGGVNVVQAVMSGGMGVSLERGAGDGEAYATPWVDAGSAAGDKVCVLIVSSNTLAPPAGGVSLGDGGDGSGLVWLRGASTGYAEVMAVRCADPAACRLHAPASGVLTVVKSGVFDLDSWGAMQERGIIYFDGGGIIQASESGYTLPPATASTLGGVIVGDGLQVTPQGVLSVIPQDLPIASQDTAGVVKAGNGVRVKSDGTLEVRLGKNLSFDESGNIDAAGGSQSVDLSDYYTRSEVDGKFLTKELAEATYATKDEIPGGGGGSDLSGYATEDWVTRNFLEKSDYTGFEVQSGSYTYGSIEGGGYTQFDISFNHSFSGTPVVSAGTNQAVLNCQVSTVNSSRFTVLLHNLGSSQVSNVHVNWWAVGEKR